MPRLVVTTADGIPVRDLSVSDTGFVPRIVELIETLPGLPLYIEGELLLPEQRASLLHQAAQLREAAARMKEDMTPAEFKQATGALAQCFEELRRGYDELRRMHFQSAREIGVMVQTHNRAVIEEGVKARFLLHQSLDDIDAMDRSTTVVKIKKGLGTAEPPAPTGPVPVVLMPRDGLWDRLKGSWHERHEGRKK